MMSRRAVVGLTAVLLLVAGLWVWRRSASGPAGPRARGLERQAEPGPLERQEIVAQAFAPVFLQKRKPNRTRTDNGDAFEDHFTRIDYDADWNGFDNSANLRNAQAAGRDLSAHVYHAVQETANYYYLHFAYFHPRDPKWFGVHENDVEGGMVVVKKTAVWGEQLESGQLVMAQAQAHNKYAYRRASELCVTALADPVHDAECGGSNAPHKTHPIFVSQAGRGTPWNHGHGTEIPKSRENLPEQAFVYFPGEAPGVPTIPPVGAVPYALVSLTGDRDGDGELDEEEPGVPSPPGLWDRRFDTRVFGRAASYPQLGNGTTIGHALQSADGCKANLPWGWHGSESNVPTGLFFLDPAHAQARATLAKYGVLEQPGTSYVSNVYLADTRVEGTFPPGPPDFDCSCDHMKAAFAVAPSNGMGPLELGPGCDLIERAVRPSLAPRAPGVTRWSTCEELEQWLAPDERTSIQKMGEPNDPGCYLVLGEESYLRLPARADGFPLSEVSRLPLLFKPDQYSAVRVRARATKESASFDLGGFWLHRGGTYEESMATVPFFARKRLRGGDWQESVLALGQSPHFRPGDDVVLLAVGQDVASRFAIASTEAETEQGGAFEIDSIELVAATATRDLAPAAQPLAITSVEPARVKYGEPVTIRGTGFAAHQCALNFVTFGDSILKILGCSASTLTVEANAVGITAVRVRVPGGRVAESSEKLTIEVEP